MTTVVAAAAALAIAAVAIAALFTRRGPRRAAIVDLGDETSLDAESGAVRSVQRADLLLEEGALEELWSPANLERLARTYWRFLSRVTLGVIRVHYSEGERFVVLLFRPLKLLTFQAPEYEMDAAHGLVRWRIARGLLVSRRGRGRGYLQIDVRRCEREDGRDAGHEDGDAHRDGGADARCETGGRARLHVEVEVASFYPSIASRLSRPIYNATQSRIHVVVTYAFLRSLARLDLAESRVGRLA